MLRVSRKGQQTMRSTDVDYVMLLLMSEQRSTIACILNERYFRNRVMLQQPMAGFKLRPTLFNPRKVVNENNSPLKL